MAGPLGSAPTILTGAALGGAASVALAPIFEPAKQKAWQKAPNRILDSGTLAALTAQGGIDLTDAHTEAALDGYRPDKLDALIYLAQTVPGVAEALRLWRLGFISDDDWTHSLVKAGMDARYLAPLNRLKDAELLGLGDIAYAVVRGILPAPSWVPVAPPTTGDKVPRFPVVDVDPVTLAGKLGFTEEALQIMVGRSGLSMAPGMAAQANFRGIIGDRDFLLAIAEGDLRTEWADAVKAVSREILTSHDSAELQLRGFLTRDERLKHTEAHGMNDADSDLLYDLLGRSIPAHQITTGEARGGTFEGPTDTIPAAYLQSLQRGNLRPEYYDLAYANRYSYPSAFFFRLLLQTGELTADEGYDAFLKLGWPPDLARKIADALATTKGTAADPHVTKAQNQLWTAAHRTYVGQTSGTVETKAALSQIGVAPASQAAILGLWDTERSMIRKQLTPAQIKKAIGGKVTNPDTGLPWTSQDGVNAMLDRGYSQEDAQTFLAE